MLTVEKLEERITVKNNHIDIFYLLDANIKFIEIEIVIIKLYVRKHLDNEVHEVKLRHLVFFLFLVNNCEHTRLGDDTLP